MVQKDFINLALQKHSLNVIRDLLRFRKLSIRCFKDQYVLNRDMFKTVQSLCINVDF